MPKKNPSNVTQLPATASTVAKKKGTEDAPVVYDPHHDAPPPVHQLTDEEIVDALNTRVDENKKPLTPVTLKTLWDECRAREVGHRSCRCGNPGCGKNVTRK